MKKNGVLMMSLIMFFTFSFDIIHAQELSGEAEKLSQIKELRESIKQHLKDNKKIEIQIEKSSKKVEKVLVKLPQNSLVSQEIIDEQISPKLEMIMSQLMQVGEYETSSWKHLNTANRLIKNKKYDAGVKHLGKANADLQEKHELMIVFEQDLEEFLIFINSLQHK